jgi:hypothetical protein
MGMTLAQLTEALENHFNAHPELRDRRVMVNMDGYNFYVERVSDDAEHTLIVLDVVTEVEE